MVAVANLITILCDSADTPQFERTFALQIEGTFKNSLDKSALSLVSETVWSLEWLPCLAFCGRHR